MGPFIFVSFLVLLFWYSWIKTVFVILRKDPRGELNSSHLQKSILGSEYVYSFCFCSLLLQASPSKRIVFCDINPSHCLPQTKPNKGTGSICLLSFIKVWTTADQSEKIPTLMHVLPWQPTYLHDHESIYTAHTDEVMHGEKRKTATNRWKISVGDCLEITCLLPW